jgi:DNA polymerase-3 subunit chi
MAEVLFYHLTRRRLEQVLPDLLGRSLQRGWRAVVKCGIPERVDALNGELWTYDKAAFLPHGSKADGFPERQPIWLTAADDRPNQAEVLFLVDGADTTQHGDYTRVCDLFDGNDDEAVQAARLRWKAAKAAGHTLTYWQQSDTGWTKAAEA